MKVFIQAAGIFILSIMAIVSFLMFMCVVQLFEFLPYNTLFGLIGMLCVGLLGHLLDKKFPIES